MTTTMSAPLRAWDYARVSHDKRHGRSTGEQHDGNRTTITRHGWAHTNSITDDDESASTFRTHDPKGWVTIREGIANQELDVLVVWSASRAQRDLEEYTKLRKLLKNSGVLWCYDGTVYDMGKRSDRLRTGFDALIAEDYAAQVQESVMRALQANAVAGRPHGRVAFGFARIYDEKTGQSRQVHNVEQAALIRDAAERFLSGESTRSIANDWKARGVPMRHADTAKHGWRLEQIKRILTNPAIAGIRVHNGERLHGDWEPIVDAETFARLEARFNDPSRKQIRQKPNVTLLAGVARCGVCGSVLNHTPLKAKGRATRYLYKCRYGAHVTRTAGRLETYVKGYLFEWVRTAGGIDDDNETAEHAATRDRIRALRAEIDEAYAMYQRKRQDGTRELSLTSFARIESEHLAEITNAEKSMRVANLPTSAHGLFASADPETYWAESLTPEQQREILRSMLEVVVHPIIDRGSRAFEAASVEVTRKH